MTQDNKQVISDNDDDLEMDTFTPSLDETTLENGNDIGNTTFTAEEIEQANRPQPNVILNKVSGDVNGSQAYKDNERVAGRANVAPDDNDTNTGGIAAGGAKGASQS